MKADYVHKDSRTLEEELLKYINFTEDKVSIDKKFYEDVFMNCFGNAIKFKKISETLEKENQALKEQVDYLRRSIERKEETIIDLEHERVPYTNEYVKELKKQLEEYKQELEKADSITQSCIFNGKKESEISYRKCLNMLKDLKKEKQEWINLLNMFKNQQKEFIEYLEEQINKWHYNYDSNTYEYELEEPTAEELLETALSKYKETIGYNEQN